MVLERKKCRNCNNFSNLQDQEKDGLFIVYGQKKIIALENLFHDKFHALFYLLKNPSQVSAQLHRALASPLVVTTLQIPAELAAATKEMKLETEFAKGPFLNFQKIILKAEVNIFKQFFL